MKASIRGFLILLFLAVFTGNSSAAHRIATWPDNRKGAVSLGFDDGCPSHLSLGAPTLNARGLKGTFFLVTGDGSNPGWPDWDAWRDVAAQGHEIGSHTKTHPWLTQIPFAQAQEEMAESKAIIDSEIPTQEGLTFVYPFGDFNSTIKSYAQSIYIGAKAISCGLNSEPFDFGNLKACSPDDQGDVFVQADAAEAQGKWLDAFFHTLDAGADGCYGVWGFDQWTSFLDYLLTKDLYVGTFGSLVRYSEERVNASLTEISNSNSRIVLSLTDTLDDAIYNRPLTIRSELPSGWISATVEQGGSSATIDSIVEGTTRVIYYDAIPDGGNITITVANLQEALQISALAPQTITAGSPGFTLQVTGGGFVSGTTLRWNGADRSTIFESATQLQAAIPATDLVIPGTVPVTVSNPGGVESDSMNFTVLAPVPSLIGLTIIDGLSILCGGENSIYTAEAIWNDNTSSVVNASWSVDPMTHASINASSGLLTTTPGGGAQTVTVQASFTYNSVTRTASTTVEISDCTAGTTPPTSSGGGGCAVVGPRGRPGLVDISSSFWALILLMAWLKGRGRRERPRPAATTCWQCPGTLSRRSSAPDPADRGERGAHGGAWRKPKKERPAKTTKPSPSSTPAE